MRVVAVCRETERRANLEPDPVTARDLMHLLQRVGHRPQVRGHRQEKLGQVLPADDCLGKDQGVRRDPVDSHNRDQGAFPMDYLRLGPLLPEPRHDFLLILQALLQPAPGHQQQTN